MHASNRIEAADFSEVEFALVDYFGTQGKSWTTDEAKTVQEILGHRYACPEGPTESDGVDPRLRRLLDTSNIKDPALFLHHIAGQLGTGPLSSKSLLSFNELLERVKCCTSDFKDAIPFLEGAKARGIRLGVISNLWPFDVQHIFFNHDQFHKHFEVLVFSHEVGHVKPEPEIFLEAARRVGLPPKKIVVIGDNLEDDVMGAVRAGMKAMHLDRAGRVKETVPGVPKLRLLTEALDYLPNRS